MFCRRAGVLLLTLLLGTTLQGCGTATTDMPVLELNITIANSSEVTYPDRIVVLPARDGEGVRVMVPKGNDLEGDDGDVQDEVVDMRGVETILLVAASMSPELHANLTDLQERFNVSTADAQNGSTSQEYFRSRRSVQPLAPLVRNKRTLHTHGGKGCLICQMLQPVQPIVIHVMKEPQGCNQCYQPQPVYHPQPQPQPVYHPQPQPQPVYHPQPQPQPVYHPQPQPQPVYHPQPQQQPVCEPCQQRQQQQHQPQSQQPQGWGSYSSSSAQSSAHSWGH